MKLSPISLSLCMRMVVTNTEGYRVSYRLLFCFVVIAKRGPINLLGKLWQGCVRKYSFFGATWSVTIGFLLYLCASCNVGGFKSRIDVGFSSQSRVRVY